MILKVVGKITPTADATDHVAVIIRNAAGNWQFNGTMETGTVGFSFNNNAKEATRFIEEVSTLDIDEVFVSHEDFVELAQIASRSIAFKIGDHDVDMSGVNEKVAVPDTL